MSACAATFSELIRRYPGGVVPKDFVKDYLWDADASEYKESTLQLFLNDDTQVPWKTQLASAISFLTKRDACVSVHVLIYMCVYMYMCMYVRHP
jgi:hypothetical protein